ncbi:hypothetical protein [uncultured Corynebacterium sp.]|uniref:hypothetical protein n=1 Tax=uncultured Corynebacterium sp. TaxID=159447 RepID=UPI0028894D6E|nr:hypothetical protein [uncultured Corynebacterium sp.]
MRSMNALRRATVAAALPAVVIAGAANATAAETTAGTPAADTDATGTANTAGIDADTPLNQLSSADPAALLQLGSSLLGGNRPDFSDLLGGNTDSNKENLPTGINALKHEAAQLEQEAGHKLFELNVIDSTHVHVGFAETYDLQKDAKALTALQQTAETNGITLTADR